MIVGNTCVGVSVPGTRVLTCSAKRVVVTEGSISAGGVAVDSISEVIVDAICAVLVGIGNAGSVEIAGVQATKIESPTVHAARMILLFGTANSPMNDDIRIDGILISKHV